MDITRVRTYKNGSMDLRGRALTVTVGSTNPVAFSVHEHLICGTSDYFKTAMKAHWETSSSGSINLKEEDPEVFEIYLHWLYFETLPVQNDNPGLEGNTEYIQLAKAYALGELLQDTYFKDAVLDGILLKSQTNATDGQAWFPVGPAIRYIYDGTPESSPARRLLVDLYTYYGRGDWLTDWASKDDLPKQFLLDLAVEALETRACPPVPLSQVKETCEYHDHQPDPNSCYLNRSASNRGKAP